MIVHQNTPSQPQQSCRTDGQNISRLGHGQCAIASAWPWLEIDPYCPCTPVCMPVNVCDCVLTCVRACVSVCMCKIYMLHLVRGSQLKPGHVQQQSSSSSSNRFIEHDVSTRKLGPSSGIIYPKKARVSGIPEEGPSFRVETSCSIKRLIDWLIDFYWKPNRLKMPICKESQLQI